MGCSRQSKRYSLLQSRELPSLPAEGEGSEELMRTEEDTEEPIDT
jgi:hypothetical protein